MIHNENFLEQIEDYCLDLLSEEVKIEFESELKLNEELRKEVKLRREIQSAIEEYDVLNLRNTIKDIANENKPKSLQNDSFDLLNEFSDIQDISEELNSVDLINFFDSLPKAHVYQHELTSNENIHHFYKEQNIAEINGDVDDMDDFDMTEFEGLEEAILERDILAFRQTLNQVAKSVEPQFTIEDIDDFLNGELDEFELKNFEAELSQSKVLKNDVKLHEELEMAICESEIIDLRAQISHIVKTETSWNVSEESIEDFIDGVLEGELLEDFRAELKENTDLMAEVKLRKQVNEMFGENDIQLLREQLNVAKEQSETKKIKNLIPDANVRISKVWHASVAVIIVLIGITGVLRSGFLSDKNSCDNYIEAPSWSPERSVPVNLTDFQRAQMAYIEKDYTQAEQILEQAQKNSAENPVFQFYRAASLQNLNKFEDAISEYTRVINHGDNIFIEEAEWFRSLCYLKSGNEKLAKQQLLAVVNRKSHYKNDAKAILRRYRFSLE